MSKKLSEVELKELQEVIGKINEVQMQIGGLEMQKQELILVGVEAKKALGETQKTLEETYGQVQIDIQTGEIKENESDS
jgi:hypothetical protein|tara:strand:+ start:1446 stop:1682 length:237 start_codon:yes stop_codon:yes gene_type:complete